MRAYHKITLGFSQTRRNYFNKRSLQILLPFYLVFTDQKQKIKKILALGGHGREILDKKRTS